MNRVVQPELLDALPPGDPDALRSRKDLQRLNVLMGNRAILLHALQNHLPRSPTLITELGAGDGSLLYRLAKKTSRAWPDVRVTLLDRQKTVSAETLTAISHLGWGAEAVVMDVFDWTPSTSGESVVITNLFLHHFEDARLSRLLDNISRRAGLFIAIEPQRFALPRLIEPLLRLIGCNAVTRHDAIVSIRAGFAGRELSRLWPDTPNWRLSERRAGMFSHLFIAQRRE